MKSANEENEITQSGKIDQTNDRLGEKFPLFSRFPLIRLTFALALVRRKGGIAFPSNSQEREESKPEEGSRRQQTGISIGLY